MERVKFYGLSDLSTPFHFDRIKNIIENSEKVEVANLLNILEIYNVLKFIKNEVYPSSLTEEDLKKAMRTFNKSISIFFNKISRNDILQSFEYFFSPEEVEENIIKKSESTELDKYSHTLFREDFLECFEKYKLNEKISEDDLDGSIQNYSIPIFYFLKTQYYIREFPLIMKKIFLGNSSNFELLLSNYTLDRSVYFIPNNITKDEMYKFCELYIGSEFANLNYIRLIGKGINGLKELSIDAKLQLKARKRSKEIEEKLFHGKNTSISKGMEFRLGVYIDKESYEKSELIFKSLVDLEYLERENYPENLLEYMMYFDYFFTDNWISNLPSFPNLESSTFSRAFSGIYTKKYYEITSYFTNKNFLVLLTFKVFQEKIKEITGSRIEELLVVFFSAYSKENFDIDWLPLDFADETQKINIQVKNLVTLEEQIRKQWKLYVEEKKIDRELFELETTPSIGSLKSLLAKKYIYINEKNKDIQKILYLLFSDQSDLIYIDEEFSANDFIQLISKNKIKKSMFHNYQQADVDFLIKNEVITINQDEEISITKKQLTRILIFSNLYKYGVIHYHHWIQKLSIKKQLKMQQREIDVMLEEGLLINENTLFAKPEVDYLNYILNNSMFDNALGLRNKYSHGSVVEENEEDYFYILVILVLYTIKINEELALNIDN